jgi:hypothetical protein
MAGKEPIDFSKVDGDESGGIGGSAKPGDEELKYSDIPSTMKGFADGLVPYYGEDCVVRLFHRRWQFREQGVVEFV